MFQTPDDRIVVKFRRKGDDCGVGSGFRKGLFHQWIMRNVPDIFRSEVNCILVPSDGSQPFKRRTGIDNADQFGARILQQIPRMGLPHESETDHKKTQSHCISPVFPDKDS
ncbi:hypothetical protein SDC9_172913 [bioreactor metagenome]|uniref:Uncharacterized protein n=1 Tax=bioreactor metagenome TaxID=1076179 RepID=A0A645GHM7_9ZZZZ